MNKLAVALGIGAAVAAGACSGSDSPTPGNLAVKNSAIVSARAVMVKVAGPVVAVAAPAGTGYHVFGKAVGTGDTTVVMVVAPQGTTLGVGDLATIQVPDTRKAGTYSVTAVQASDASNAVISTGGFALTVGQP